MSSRYGRNWATYIASCAIVWSVVTCQLLMGVHMGCAPAVITTLAPVPATHECSVAGKGYGTVP
jgi:hypothetical protein